MQLVLGRIIEASHLTSMSYFGELDCNEMRSNMISLWNTHGYRTYLFEIVSEDRASSCPSRDSAGIRLLPASGLNKRLSLVFEQRALFFGLYGMLTGISQ
jgi:hypothetical protein